MEIKHISTFIILHFMEEIEIVICDQNTKTKLNQFCKKQKLELNVMTKKEQKDQNLDTKNWYGTLKIAEEEDIKKLEAFCKENHLNFRID